MPLIVEYADSELQDAFKHVKPHLGPLMFYS